MTLMECMEYILGEIEVNQNEKDIIKSFEVTNVLYFSYFRSISAFCDCSRYFPSLRHQIDNEKDITILIIKLYIFHRYSIDIDILRS